MKESIKKRKDRLMYIHYIRLYVIIMILYLLMLGVENYISDDLKFYARFLVITITLILSFIQMALYNKKVDSLEKEIN